MQSPSLHRISPQVLDCPSPTACVLINPHVGRADRDRPLYGGYTAMQTVVPGDHLSLYGWPATGTWNLGLTVVGI